MPHDFFSGTEGLLVLLAAIGAYVLGVLTGRHPVKATKKDVARLEAELARSENQALEQARLVTRQRNEQETVVTLMRFLPGFARELNRARLSEREIPNLLFGLAEAIFEPEQLLLFLAPSPKEDDEEVNELVLVEHRGLGEHSPSPVRVRIGEDKVGWVAENKIEMLNEDWQTLARTEGGLARKDDPSFRLDMIAPLVQHGHAKEQILGVLCVGGPKARPNKKEKEERLLLQMLTMLTNLGAIAIVKTRNETKLRGQANHDGLTGLVNKSYFMRLLGELINRVERQGQPLGVFIFDIDHFKKYNDLNGHPAGDELLKTLAKVILTNLRPGDTACRYGGEEFVVAMPKADGAAALQAAERIREAIASYRFPHGDKQPGGKLTISGGVAAAPVDGRSSTDLIAHSDQALYEAKAEGRNKVVPYKGVQFGESGDDGLTDASWLPEPGSAYER